MSNDSNRSEQTDLLDAIRKIHDAHIVYTLATDGNFTIDAESTAQKKVKQINELLPRMEQELRDCTLGYTTIIRCLREIRTELEELNQPSRPTLTSLIEANANVEPVCEGLLADSAGEDVSVDINELLISIVECMSKMCSQARDVNISHLKQIDSIPKKIGGILVTLKEMDVDMANFMITAVKGTCRDHWKPWITQKFDEITKLTTRHDIDILKDTREWLKNTYSLYPLIDKHNLVKRAVADLLKPGRLPPFPCTLEFEAKSLIEVKTLIYHRILYLCIHLIGKELKISWSPSIDDEISVLLKEYPNQSVLQVVENVALQIQRGLPQTETSIVSAICRLADLDKHPVFSILLNRLETTFMEMLECHKTTEAELIIKASNMDSEIKKLIFRFYVGSAINLYVFDDIYRSILENL